MQMGLREANQSFSKAIKRVKSGEEVVLTERGKPIAVIKPLNGNVRGKAAILRHLETIGMLRPAGKPSPLPVWTPRPLKGAPMSRTLREERDRS